MGELLTRIFIKNNDNVKDPRVRGAYGRMCGAVGVVCNVLLFLFKLLVGMLSGSVAITADAVNNLSDASSSIISLLGFKLAEKSADDEHPYGHGRYEYLSALTVAALVLVIGFEMVGSSFDKILHPTPVEFGLFPAIVLVVSILTKLWMAAFNGKIGKRINSTTLIATAKDSRNDVISTSAVLISALISRFTSLELDGWMGMAVALFILYSAHGLLVEAISPLLGDPPSADFVSAITEKIKSYPKVLDTHDLIIHDYGPGRKFASVHVEMAAEDDVLECHDIIDNIERDLSEEFGMLTSIHYDPVVTSDPRIEELKSTIHSILGELDEDISMHDLRIVPGSTHTNVIFDCVLPRSSKMSEAEFKSYVSEKVAERHDNHFCVITVDRSFTTQG